MGFKSYSIDKWKLEVVDQFQYKKWYFKLLSFFSILEKSLDIVYKKK